MVQQVHSERESLCEKGFCWLYLKTDALSGIPDKEQIPSSDAEPIC